MSSCGGGSTNGQGKYRNGLWHILARGAASPQLSIMSGLGVLKSSQLALPRNGKRVCLVNVLPTQNARKEEQEVLKSMHISRKDKAITTTCLHCRSTEIEEFNAKISMSLEKVHMSGKVTVCLECGSAEYLIPETALTQLRLRYGLNGTSR